MYVTSTDELVAGLPLQMCCSDRILEKVCSEWVGYCTDELLAGLPLQVCCWESLLVQVLVAGRLLLRLCWWVGGGT